MELTEEQKINLVELVIRAIDHLFIIDSLYTNKDNNDLIELEKERCITFLDKIKELNITREQYLSTISFFKDYSEYIEKDLTDTLIYDTKTELVIKRILNAIRDNIINNGDCFDIDKKLSNNSICTSSSFDEYFDWLNSVLSIKTYIENDLYTILIDNIDSEINDSYNDDIITELTKIKYRLLYLYPNFEYLYIFNKNERCLLSKLVGDRICTNDIGYDDILEDYTLDLIDNSLEEISTYENNDLKEKDIKLSLILRLNLILSSLILGDKEIFQYFLNTYEEIEPDLDDSIKDLLEEVMNSYQIKKEKYKVLSLKKDKYNY